MEGLSLEALMAELAQVQKAPSVTKLSEPNVVEVMQKLSDLGLLNVLFTTNGKEYLTPKQLRHEVEDEIIAHGGRVNVTELPPILNVDLPHIERVIEQLLREDASLQLFQGEVIAEYYLDGVAEEINQTLQSEGRLMLGDLAMRCDDAREQPLMMASLMLTSLMTSLMAFLVASLVVSRMASLTVPLYNDGLPDRPPLRRYSLTTDFVTRLVEPRLGTVVDAKLSGSTLYTTGYVARHGARVRGVLSAVLRPAALPQLIREHAFNEVRVQRGRLEFFSECLSECFSECFSVCFSEIN